MKTIEIETTETVKKTAHIKLPYYFKWKGTDAVFAVLDEKTGIKVVTFHSFLVINIQVDDPKYFLNCEREEITEAEFTKEYNYALGILKEVMP